MVGGQLPAATTAASMQAERWEQTANRLDAQLAARRAEDDETAAILRHAEEKTARVRAEVAAPLVEQAEHDGMAYLASFEKEVAAIMRLATIGRFGKRRARAEQRTTRV